MRIAQEGFCMLYPGYVVNGLVHILYQVVTNTKLDFVPVQNLYRVATRNNRKLIKKDKLDIASCVQRLSVCSTRPA